MSSSAITSRIEWSASLDPTKAQVPTEETKYHRKVCLQRSGLLHAPQMLTSPSSRLCSPDVYHRDHWYAYMRSGRCDLVSERVENVIVGPNTNTIEKLTELRRAGVNIGVFTLFSYRRSRPYAHNRACCQFG